MFENKTEQQAKDMEQQRKQIQRTRRRNTNFERQEQTMAKTIFEEMGGTYTQVGDYLLPDLKLPEEETQANIGVWGMRHKRFLKENHRVLYANLMTSGKLVAYLEDIEQQATAMFLRLVKELAEKENVTEELKATDQMLWVQKMNNIRNRATEIVNAELIYTV